MKRIIVSFILSLLLALLLTGCNPSHAVDTVEPQETTQSAPETTAPASADIVIVKDGVANYRIVRGDQAPQTTIDQAMQMVKLISNATGVTPEITTDWVKKGSEHDHSSYEILIGQTAYSESVDALSDLAYGDYVITQVGNKLVINAWSPDGLKDACSKVRNLIREHMENNNLVFPAGLHVVGTTDEKLNHLPVYENGTLSSIYDAGGDTQLFLFDDTTPEAYAAYRTKVSEMGYTLYAENEITDNHFATYTNDICTLHMGYYAYEKAVRVTVEPLGALPPRESDNVYVDAKIQPSVAQIGLGVPVEGSPDKVATNGQSQIFQLADGSFIIVDGGNNNSHDAKAIYDYLYANAPDPNDITIAAWFITHTHGDHDGAFRNFCVNYASKVDLELLVGNFPSQAARDEGGISSEGLSGIWLSGHTKYYKDAKFVRAHAGQEFYLRDAKIEILYTLESYSPKKWDYFNDSSVVFRVELGGQVINILGDAGQEACMIVNKMYGDYLKADIVQAAHHGYQTGRAAYDGVTAVYDNSAAPVVLWPVDDGTYANLHKRAYNAHLQNLETTREIFVAGDRNIRLLLPYTPGTSGYLSIIK